MLSFSGLNQFLSIRGYAFYLGLLYIMIVLLVFVCGLCVWVGRAFRDNTFSHVWPIQVRQPCDAQRCSVAISAWSSVHAGGGLT